MSRRKWFFGVMAFVLLLDVADTWLKGMPYLRAQGPEYLGKTALGVVLFAMAPFVESQRFHLTLVWASLVYQAWWILRLYDVLG